MMTLENYLNVAYMWYAEKQENFNPFESARIQVIKPNYDYAQFEQEQDAEFDDYNGALDDEEINKVHEEKFDLEEALGKTQSVEGAGNTI